MQPCILTRWSKQRAALYNAPSPGRALIIGTPEGYNYLYDLYNLKEKSPGYNSYHYNYTSSPFLDPEDIERYRHTLDPLEFASEYLASFEESGTRVFYAFERDVHVQTVEDFASDEVIHVPIDFNVGIMCAAAIAIRGGQPQVIDEFKTSPNTEQLAITLKNKYKDHKIIAYPDPTGRSRKSSAPVGVTDFSILQSNGIECLARSKSPPIVDSVAAVNRLCKTAAGVINFYVHPRCTGVIDSMIKTAWVQNSDNATIDKSKGLEHFSDGIRYFSEYNFPILKGTKRTERGFAF